MKIHNWHMARSGHDDLNIPSRWKLKKCYADQQLRLDQQWSHKKRWWTLYSNIWDHCNCLMDCSVGRRDGAKWLHTMCYIKPHLSTLAKVWFTFNFFMRKNSLPKFTLFLKIPKINYGMKQDQHQIKSIMNAQNADQKGWTIDVTGSTKICSEASIAKWSEMEEKSPVCVRKMCSLM